MIRRAFLKRMGHVALAGMLGAELLSRRPVLARRNEWPAVGDHIEIRNVVGVQYRDGAGGVSTLRVADTESVAQHGPGFVEFEVGEPLSDDEAQRFAEKVIADLMGDLSLP